MLLLQIQSSIPKAVLFSWQVPLVVLSGLAWVADWKTYKLHEKSLTLKYF